MSPATTANVNRESVENLKLLMGVAYPGLVASYLGNTEGYIEDIVVAIKGGDRHGASVMAHKMKSSSSQFGMLELQDLAKQIEYSQELSDPELLDLASKLGAAFSAATQFLLAHSSQT